MTELSDVTSAEIAAELVRARTRAGSPVMGMVLTLVVVTDEDGAEAAMDAARAASREHPARLLGVVLGDGRGRGHVDAHVRTGTGGSGEVALIRLRGEVVRHASSVVLPLLLPDAPVAVWWPADAPADPAADPLGALGQRRITDAAAATRRRTTVLRTQCGAYSPGDTDLAWTRLTRWRALLAASLDLHPGRVRSARVGAEAHSPSADLLAAWLELRLKITVERVTTSGPGITETSLTLADGEVRITRPGGGLATLSSPGRPDQSVALPRRELPDLLGEELRRLDEDEVYAALARRVGSRRRRT
ncbi:glucose-6-phosphate dehydrogenase assembly protein OpcA [Nocardioides donggukensis]|uniref:Glucose-6-phosphate dehydrogenase assembly protein OpcA n=1 Tax=Nocardioides donggukensis TaxID=2774019 RepID=A0A927K3Z1_9ACTN|nr:glucose-6-phosphate dehydrogenase assembly protein OpcA [Nocardioides donggukensis]MBD8869376.1 glucose-6-phosphate dehydrogenase assembly protein OpcA [Nocardioides donggukensis]